MLDKLRFVPVLNLATLWWYAVDGMRYPGVLSRYAKLLGTVIVAVFGAGTIALITSWAPEWVKGCVMFLGLYGIVVAAIYSLRGDVLQQKRLWAERH